MLGVIFLSEVVGTAMLILLGCGVVANNLLPKSKGNKGLGSLQITWGWGFAVMFGAMVAYKSGGHLNPAVTVGFAVSGMKEFVPGVAVSFSSIMVYIAGQMVGAFIGAVLCWLAYKNQFDEDCDPALKLGVFSTGPEIRNPLFNTITEIIGTFVLLFGIFGSIKATAHIGGTPANLSWLATMGVGFLVFSIGASLGGPTGYAINPARDLAPRIAHAILPIKGKGGSDWGYSWVPVVGPMIGAVLAGLASNVLLP